MSDETKTAAASDGERGAVHTKQPNAATARRMGEIAAEKGMDDLSDYLLGVADWIDSVAGSVFIPGLNSGDEIVVMRKTKLVVP